MFCQTTYKRRIRRRQRYMILLLAVWSAVSRVYGQTDAQLSQQMFSRINYNPASSGLSEDMYLYVLARQQWIGFREAPQTVVVNGHTFVPWTQSGWGFSIIADRLGFEQSVNPKIRYAYHIPFMASKSTLSLGIGGGVMYKSVDFNRAEYENPADPEESAPVSQVRPDFDFGLEYNTKYFHVGGAVTHLGNKSDRIRNTATSPHLYLYGRGMIDLSKTWQLTPAISWHNNKNIHQIEANLTLFMKKRFWVGGSYRLQESAVFLAGAYITPNLMLGYSYDYSMISLSNYETGSHEIMLSLRIPQPKKSMRAARLRECYHSWW